MVIRASFALKIFVSLVEIRQRIMSGMDFFLYYSYYYFFFFFFFFFFFIS